MFIRGLGDTFTGLLSVRVHGPICQNVFLRNMGIDLRLRMLLGNCKSKEQANNLVGAYHIMMDSGQMGDRFKFLSILPSLQCYPDQYLPAGFCQLE